MKIAEKLSKILNDIIGKMLGIPISFVAIIALNKSKSLTESLFIVLGLIIAAIVLSGTVANQQNQFRRIKHSINLIVNSIEGRKDIYPADLKDKIKEMTTGLVKNQRRLSIILWTFRILSWVPVIVAMIDFVYTYPIEISFNSVRMYFLK